MAYCSRCGAEILENARFCTGCGAPIESNSKPAASAEPVETGASVEPTTPVTPAAPTPASTPVSPVVPPVSGNAGYEAPPSGYSTETEDPFSVGAAQEDVFTGLKKKMTPKKFLIFSGIIAAALLLFAGGLTVFAVVGGERVPDNDFYGTDYDDSWDDWDSDWGDWDDVDGTGLTDHEYRGTFAEVSIPDSWRSHYNVTDNGDSVTFYNVENAEAGFGGTLVTINRYPAGEDYSFLPDYKVIYSAPNYTYIAVYPTDLQYDSDDEDLTALYQKMASELTDSFLWNIHIAEE